MLVQLGLEGVIGKRADAPYVSARSSSWIKLKCTQRQEFVIGGYTDPRGARSGLGSLLLGVHDKQGQLIYAGNVGTGFDEKTLVKLKEQLAALDATKTPFHQLPSGIKGHWVKPKLVAEVSFGEWTNDGRIRHSVFHGLRTDKSPGAITKEDVVDESAMKKTSTRKTGNKHAAADKATKTPTRQMAKATTKSGSVKAAAATAAGIKISNPDRVVDSSTGLTKLDLVRYYEGIAEYISPHLKGRPTSLVRGRAGLGASFFSETCRHPTNSRRQRARPCVLARAPANARDCNRASVGAGRAVECHRVSHVERNGESIENPDRLLFDLDPGEGVQWQQVVEGTMLVKAFSTSSSSSPF